MTQEKLDIIEHIKITEGLTLVSANAGSGKEQPLTSKILTPSGWSTMGKMKVGTIITHPISGTAKVVSVHPQGRKPVYEVHFSDGTFVECGLKHLWQVENQEGKSSVISTEDLIDSTDKWYIPTITNKEIFKPNKSVSPYFEGYTIATSSLKSFSLQVPCKRTDVGHVKAGIKAYPTEMSYFRRVTADRSSAIIHKTRLYKTTKAVLREKTKNRYIPKRLLKGTYNERLSVLKGILAGVGSLIYKGTVYRCIVTSKQLSSDIVQLVMSLGGTATIAEKVVGTEKYKYTRYNINIRLGILMPVDITTRLHPQVRRRIISIVKTSKIAKQKCIMLDRKDGLYITDNYTVTHNTHLLVGISKELKPTTGLYIAYTKAVATEAKRKFPSTINCSTVHSLAFGYTVKPHGLKLGPFSYRDITRLNHYPFRLLVVEKLKEFCVSEYITVDDFATKNVMPKVVKAELEKILDEMELGKINCTHDFYLKLFHMSLADGDIVFNNLDLLMLDESGDINPVTYEIFKLLPATRKVMVGDANQNIFQFNHTINCFDKDNGEAKTFSLTQSFRTCPEIATRIQSFCNRYLDPNMRFTGVIPESTKIITRAYISRTNNALIAKMMELNEISTPYGLTRPPKNIFSGVLSLCNLKHHGTILDPNFKFIQKEVDRYYEEDDIKRKFPSVLKYLKYVFDEDEELQATIRLVGRYGIASILDCYNKAKFHAKKSQTYTLGTGHSTKGLEYDEVEVATDANTAISKLLARHRYTPNIEDLTPEEIAELNLYYVICSRAKLVLNNAIHL